MKGFPILQKQGNGITDFQCHFEKCGGYQAEKLHLYAIEVEDLVSLLSPSHTSTTVHFYQLSSESFQFLSRQAPLLETVQSRISRPRVGHHCEVAHTCVGDPMGLCDSPPHNVIALWRHTVNWFQGGGWYWLELLWSLCSCLSVLCFFCYFPYRISCWLFSDSSGCHLWHSQNSLIDQMPVQWMQSAHWLSTVLQPIQYSVCGKML